MWAEVILQSRKTHSFGTTFQALEVIRRLHKGKRILYFAFYEPNNHNRHLSLIFGDNVRFFSLRRPELVFHQVFGKPLILPPRKLHDQIATWLNRIWSAVFAREGTIIYDDPLTLNDALYELPDLKKRLPSSISVRDSWNSDGVQSVFMSMFDMEALRLPCHVREEIWSKIGVKAAMSAGSIRGYCGFWLKQDPPHEKEWKNGSPVENYELALECLVAAGYVVLWHGDRQLPENYRQKFENRLFDAAELNVEEDIFNLFVPTESDIFIGDSGPGLWMACCNGTPTLGLNLFPIGIAFRINWAYFKHIVDKTGKRVPYDEVLSTCPRDEIDTPDGWQEVTMNAEELCDAVREFIAAPVPAGNDAYAWVGELLPDWSSFKMSSHVRLSPAWIRHNEVPSSPPNS